MVAIVKNLKGAAHFVKLIKALHLVNSSGMVVNKKRVSKR